MGGESLMRGYYLGRYRDRHLLATQIEYRILPFTFSKRWGASVFLAMGQVFGENISEDNSKNGFQFKNILPTGGAGLACPPIRKRYIFQSRLWSYKKWRQLLFNSWRGFLSIKKRTH